MAAKAPTEELEKLSVQEGANANGHNGAAAEHSADESDDAEDQAADAGAGAEKKKKKKRKPKKKKKKAAGAQTDPPSVKISDLFPNNNYPKGEETEYVDENRSKTTKEEERHLANMKMNDEFLSDYRQAAEAHRQVRQWAQRTIKPGDALLDVANGIEDSVRRLVGHDGLATGDAKVAGMGFPLGLNLDHIAAHYSPNPGEKPVYIEDSSVLKVDIGVHVNGRIVDSAFTMAWDPKYDNLLAAVKDATNTGVKHAGVDARLSDLGEYIQEAMESYECELDGTTYPIKSIRNLTGHTIMPYSIHGDKAVPIVKGSNEEAIMEEGDVFAIETFGSTGNGYVIDQGAVSHYALRSDAPKMQFPLESTNKLRKVIENNFGTLPWCRRYLERYDQKSYLLGLKQLVKAGIVEDYPPLLDKEGSYTAQFEHTLLIRPGCKEIISRGDDY